VGVVLGMVTFLLLHSVQNAFVVLPTISPVGTKGLLPPHLQTLLLVSVREINYCIFEMVTR
jgi:hypothetical protein